MSPDSDGSVLAALGDRLAQALGHAGLAEPAQVLVELARPWRVIAGQLLLMSEPLCSAEQRGPLRESVRALSGWTKAVDMCEVPPAEADTEAGSP